MNILSPGQWVGDTFKSARLLAFFIPIGLLAQPSKGLSQRPVGEIRREIFLASPAPRTAVLANTYYTTPTGTALISIHELMTRSDTTETAYFRSSLDHGHTWSAATEMPTLEVRPQGKLRRMMRGAWVDPRTGRLLRFRIEGILPNDDPLEGMKQWVVYYSASEDGGRTWYLDEPIIHRGAEFSRTHPIPGVETGRTCFMIGDTASVPLQLDDGTILIPVIITPSGPDGEATNPGGGYTYTDAAVLHGRWLPDGRRLEWQLSARVQADPARSTRGMDEPTLALLNEGRLMMILRGSNHTRPALPARRWVAFSGDRGHTWTAPVPWTFSDGTNFFSPASCSQLINHSSGRVFWLGNITPENPVGNRPRFPFVIGEVDRRTGLLQPASLRVVDDRGPGDSPDLSLSNFSAREDRTNGEIILHLSRLFQHSTPTERDWTSDAWWYHIPVE